MSNKYVNGAIAAAIGTAGIGALIRQISANREEKKIEKVEDSKNAIVVPVSIKKFMDGLPVPQEHSSTSVDAGGSDVAPVIQAGSVDSAEGLSDEDISAIKKDILKGRKVDFFKHSSAKKAEDKDNAKSDEKEDIGESNSDSKSEAKNEDKDKERVVYRDGDGKFVSPTNPVAVASVEKYSGSEKSAEGGWTDFFVHPIDSAKVMWNSAKGAPVAWSAGAVGSVVAAKMISDYIMKMRRDKSKKRLEEDRMKYIHLLDPENSEEVEKSAADPREVAGTTVGAAFVVPGVLAAMITNKIINNRKEEKKKQEDMSNSYPEEPVVLYKTSEDKIVEISPETALFGIMVKRAMFESACRDEMEIREMERGMPKSGASIGGALRSFGRFMLPADTLLGKGVRAARDFVSAGIDNAKDKTVQVIGDAVTKKIPMGVDEAENVVMGMLENADNNEHLLNIVKNPDAGLSDKAQEQMAAREDPVKMLRLKTFMSDPKNKAELMKRIKTGKRMQNLVMDRAADRRYSDSWGKYRDGEIDNYLGTFFGGRNNWLFKIVSWLAKNTGIGNYFARNFINNKFDRYRKQYMNKETGGAGNNPAAGAQSGNAPQTPPAPPSNQQNVGKPTPPVPPAQPVPPAKPTTQPV